VAQAVHLPLLAKHRELFEIAALCDLSPSARDALGDRFGVPPDRRFASADELVAAGGLDAIAILTSGSHAELACAAGRAGLAVFCEKPLAFTLEDADAVAQASPRLMLGYMKLYDPAVERARELLVGLPEPRSIEVTVLHPPAPPQLAHAGLAEPANDVDPAFLGRLGTAEAVLVERAIGGVPPGLARLYVDVLLGSVVHDLAVIRYLLGGPLEVEDADAWTGGDGPGSVSVLARLGPARVSIRWHALEHYPAYREEVRVHHDGGTVALAFPSPYLLHAPTELTVVDGDGAGERRTLVRSTIEAFEEQWLAFAALARDGAAPRAGAAEGRADILVCQRAAAALAAREGVAIGGEAARGLKPVASEYVQTRESRLPTDGRGRRMGETMAGERGG
jgi:predicted dehydrogenase